LKKLMKWLRAVISFHFRISPKDLETRFQLFGR
jgi:hypothetical protein